MTPSPESEQFILLRSVLLNILWFGLEVILASSNWNDRVAQGR